MRALVTTGDGGVTMRDVAEPARRPGDVLVHPRAASLNRGELRVLAGTAGVIPGWDVAGVLVDDEPVLGLQRGTPVVALADGGGWAEMVAVELDRVTPIPDGVSLEHAAVLPVAGLTALQALRLGGALLGKDVLITGAAGGVGRLAVQLARMSGARVTAVARDAARAAGLRELGARTVVSTLDDLDERFDLVLESVGGDSLTEAARLLAPDGDLVTFGASSGRPGSIDPRHLFNASPGARIHAYQVFESDVASIRRDLATLLRLVADGELDPQVDRVAGWEEAGELLAALDGRRVNGKSVLRIDHTTNGRS
ncbi:MAG TPA: zinc-binding dehydrogenase [Capillimicrobium sp.]|nr:zinc-binding dehydrogenase [Capillimicrobium sp.]